MSVISWLLAALILFVPFREVAAYLVDDKVKLLADTIVMAIVIIAITTKNMSFKFNKVDIAFASFMSASLLSTFINGTDLASAALQLRGFSIYYILYFTLRNLMPLGEKYNTLILLVSKTLATAVVALVSFAIIEVLSSKGILFPQEWSSEIRSNNLGRAYSLIGNPNTFAAFLLISAFLISFLRQTLDARIRQVVFFLVAIGVALTQSRSGLLVGVAALAYPAAKHAKIAFLSADKHARYVVIVLAFTVLALASTAVIMAPSSKYGDNRLLDAINGNELRNSLIDGRIYLINRSLDVYTDHGNYLLGIGAGMLNNQTNEINEYGLGPGYTSDNQYLKILVETGIVGFLSFAALITTLFLQYRRSAAIVAATLLMLFWALFYNSFEIQTIALYFWLLLGLHEMHRPRR